MIKYSIRGENKVTAIRDYVVSKLEKIEKRYFQPEQEVGCT